MVYLDTCEVAVLSSRLESLVISLAWESSGAEVGVKAGIEGFGFLSPLGIWETSQEELDKAIKTRFLQKCLYFKADIVKDIWGSRKIIIQTNWLTIRFGVFKIVRKVALAALHLGNPQRDWMLALTWMVVS